LGDGAGFQIPTTVAATGDAIDTNQGNLTIGADANHDINGTISLGGNASFGAGTYTINGALNGSITGAGSGGRNIIGAGVTFVTSGPVGFGKNYTNISLSSPAAPTHATQGAVSTVVIASESATASTVWADATTAIQGTIYAPSAALSLGGSGSLSGGGGCLEAIANSLSLSGSSAMTTSCAGIQASSSSGVTGVALVQ